MSRQHRAWDADFAQALEGARRIYDAMPAATLDPLGVLQRKAEAAWKAEAACWTIEQEGGVFRTTGPDGRWHCTTIPGMAEAMVRRACGAAVFRMFWEAGK